MRALKPDPISLHNAAKAAIPPPLRPGGIDSPPPLSFKKAQSFIDTHKNKINYATNGVAALFNLGAFVEGNWNLLGIQGDWMEKVCNFFSKLATGTQGVLGASDTWNKHNLVPTPGFALEVPIALFTSGYNLWFARGISQGWAQLQAIFKRRVLTTIKDRRKFLGDNFKDRGGIETAFKANLKEAPKLLKDIFKKPFERTQRLPNGLAICSFFQIAGPLIWLAGFEKIGAFIRDLFGAASDFAFMTDLGPNAQLNPNLTQDELSKDKPKGKSYVPAGIVWVGAAVVDFVKRFTDKIANSTQLSLFFDRLASLFYAQANFDSLPKDDPRIITQQELEELHKADSQPVQMKKAA